MIRKGFKADLKWPQQSQNLFLSDKNQPVGQPVPVDEETSSYQIYRSHARSFFERFNLSRPLSICVSPSFSLRWETEASSFYIDREAGLCEIRGHKAGSNRKTSLIIKDGRESFPLQRF